MKKYVESLLTLRSVFNKHDIDFWLEAGTLLGAIREGRIIPWDDDADISLWLDEIFKVLETQKDFQQLGYELYVTQGHYALRDMKTKEHLVCIYFNKNVADYVVKLQFLRPFKYFIWMLSEPDYKTVDYNNFDYDTKFIPFFIRKILVDICCKMQPAKRRKLIILFWKLTIQLRLYYDELVRFPVKCVDDFIAIDFYGEKFSVPKHYNEYLTFMYGDWRIPVKNFKAHLKRLKDVKAIK